MKIWNDELIHKVWLAQLKKISRCVCDRYIGGGIGVCRKENYQRCSSIHIIERQKITDKIGAQQLRKRIIDLIDDGFLIWTYRDLTFMIDTEQAKEAFEAARQFMLSKGVPCGWDDENKRMRTVRVGDAEALFSECHEHLIGNFKQIDWDEVYSKVNAA